MVVEATFFAGPDSFGIDGGPRDWLVEASFGSEQLADGIDYVNDGQTLTVEMHTDAIDDSEDLNIVGVSRTLTYSEDETSSGLGCAAPGASNPDPDTITGTVVHNEHNTTASGQNSGAGVSSHILLKSNGSMLL